MKSKENCALQVNGSLIHYELSGNPKGKLLLLLHGGLGCGSDFLPIHEFVTPDYQLLSIDFRGHGKSTLGELPLSYKQYQQDVEAVLSHLGVSRYAIFGFSDGGIVGYRLAANNRDKVSCLITLGSQWRLEEDDPSRSLLSGLTPAFWSETFPESVSHYYEVNPSPDFNTLIDRVKAVWLDTTKTGYPCDLVDNIDCPVLLMRGDDDFLFSLDEAVALKNRLTDVAFANIPFTMHAAHQESPLLVGNIVRDFLSQKLGKQ